MIEMFNDPRVIYLKGNHEDMMYYSYRSYGLSQKQWDKLWRKNGGKETKKQIQELNISKDILDYYLDLIYDLPYCVAITNSKGTLFYLSHAGFTPDSKFFNLSDKQAQEKFLWDRDHIFENSWPQDMENIKIIHGHTPIGYCHKNKTQINGIVEDFPLVYQNGHKINLDISTANTDIVLVYNLDEERLEYIVKGETN